MSSYHLVISLLWKSRKKIFFSYKYHVWEVLGRSSKNNYNKKNNNKKILKNKQRLMYVAAVPRRALLNLSRCSIEWIPKILIIIIFVPLNLLHSLTNRSSNYLSPRLEWNQQQYHFHGNKQRCPPSSSVAFK